MVHHQHQIVTLRVELKSQAKTFLQPLFFCHALIFFSVIALRIHLKIFKNETLVLLKPLIVVICFLAESHLPIHPKSVWTTEL